METCPPVVIVVAMSHKKRAIGNKNQLLWHIPADLKRFKALTLGHPIIMGKNTFLSIVEILGKPLPNRTNIVLTRDQNYSYEGVKIAHTLVEAVELAKEESPTEIHIGGGAELYRQSLMLASKLYVTLVHDEPEADTFFPEYEDEFEAILKHPPAEHEGLVYQWIDYERKSS